MKTTLTIQESAELIKRGVKRNKASRLKPRYTKSGYCDSPYRIFTLADLFSLLPKGIIHNGLSCKLRITSWYDEPYFAGYMNQVGKYIMGNPYDAPFSAEELIDVIFELLCWAIDHNHVKLD